MGASQLSMNPHILEKKSCNNLTRSEMHSPKICMQEPAGHSLLRNHFADKSAQQWSASHERCGSMPFWEYYEYKHNTHTTKSYSNIVCALFDSAYCTTFVCLRWLWEKILGWRHFNIPVVPCCVFGWMNNNAVIIQFFHAKPSYHFCRVGQSVIARFRHIILPGWRTFISNTNTRIITPDCTDQPNDGGYYFLRRTVCCKKSMCIARYANVVGMSAVATKWHCDLLQCHLC